MTPGIYFVTTMKLGWNFQTGWRQVQGSVWMEEYIMLQYAYRKDCELYKQKYMI